MTEPRVIGIAPGAIPQKGVVEHQANRLRAEFKKVLLNFMRNLSRDREYQNLLKSGKYGNAYDIIERHLDAALEKNVFVKRFIDFMDDKLHFIKSAIIKGTDKAFREGEKKFYVKIVNSLARWMGKLNMTAPIPLVPAGEALKAGPFRVITMRRHNLYEIYLYEQAKLKFAAGKASAKARATKKISGAAARIRGAKAAIAAEKAAQEALKSGAGVVVRTAKKAGKILRKAGEFVIKRAH